MGIDVRGRRNRERPTGSVREEEQRKAYGKCEGGGTEKGLREV